MAQETAQTLTASAPARVTIIPLRSILVSGQHCAAGQPVELDQPVAEALLALRAAVLPEQTLPWAQDAIETAAYEPVGIETATAASAAAQGSPKAAARAPKAKRAR